MNRCRGGENRVLKQGWRGQGVENAESKRIAHSQGTSTEKKKNTYSVADVLVRPSRPNILVAVHSWEVNHGG
jgi:hypothetical protein